MSGSVIIDEDIQMALNNSWDDEHRLEIFELVQGQTLMISNVDRMKEKIEYLQQTYVEKTRLEETVKEMEKWRQTASKTGDEIKRKEEKIIDLEHGNEKIMKYNKKLEKRVESVKKSSAKLKQESAELRLTIKRRNRRNIESRRKLAKLNEDIQIITNHIDQERQWRNSLFKCSIETIHQLNDFMTRPRISKNDEIAEEDQL